MEVLEEVTAVVRGFLVRTNIRRKILPIFRKVVKFLSEQGIDRIYPIKVALYNFLLPCLKNPNSIVRIQGHKMYLDPMDAMGLSVWGIHEPLVTKVFKKEIKKGNVVLDIGAHIGYYTLIAAKLVGENGKVFAFEPEPTNFNLLERNVKANGYKNVILVQKAVSNKTGKIKLYLSEDNTGDHRIYDSHDGRRPIEIEAIRLDDYFKNREEKIDFIKIDTQGSEAWAIQGMPLLLRRNRVKIITEFEPPLLRKSGVEPREYLDILSEYGFKLYQINDQENKIELITRDKLMQMCENSTNLLCLK